MIPGQRVRVRPASPIVQRHELPAETQGTIVCSYRVRCRANGPERVDVRLAGDTIIWGVAADEFEVIEEPLARAS